MKWTIVLAVIGLCFVPAIAILLAAAFVDWPAFGRWFQARVLGRSDIWFAGSRYMRRWLFGPKGWYGLRLHCIECSDADRELHDHPFSFVSIILRGGYWEHTPDGRRTWYGPGSVVFRSAEALHRLELENSIESGGTWHGYPTIVRVPRKAWTLVIRGPHRRRWGFVKGGEWESWQRFTSERDGKGEAAGEYAAVSSI